MNKFILLVFFCLISSFSVNAQKTDSISEKSLNHSVYVDPLLPLFDLLIINYGLKYNTRHEGVFGFVMSKATTTPTKYYEYPGYINSIGANIGHRYYIYKGFHADLWFMPAYNSIYEENENRFYKSFSIYNEYRVGYKIDFNLFKLPLLANFQWPLGVSLIDTNKPNSFKEIDKKDPIFYLFIPNIWIGYRF
jgi:hypothetical protein